MLRATVLTALLLATPALAAPVTLTIDNQSSQAVSKLNVFGVGRDGQPVEDNVGGLLDDVPPHSKGQLQLSISECQPVWAAMSLSDDAEELTATIDTCKSVTLVVTD